ncbi:MAG: hypothetical protein ACP5JG_09595 [Anaerolineae bacterium]
MRTLPHLREAVARLGKLAWRPMLRYVAELHERSIYLGHDPLIAMARMYDDLAA